MIHVLFVTKRMVACKDCYDVIVLIDKETLQWSEHDRQLFFYAKSF